jgi:hypothetical protein
LLWICLLTGSLSAGAIEPNEPNEPTGPAVPVGWYESAKIDLKDFPSRLGEDTKRTFVNTGNLIALGWAGAASAIMHNGGLDRRIADHFDEHDTFDNFSDEALNVAGSPITHFGATAIWYVVSAENQDDRNKQCAITMLSALTINGAVTGGLKMIRQNDQPDGQIWAWPSGHTSSSVTVASVLHEFYGLKVGIPAYIGAGLVGWRMMDDGDHWASDILFGAMLGWVVGHTVARHHEDPGIAGFEVTPYYGNQWEPAVGINLTRRF